MVELISRTQVTHDAIWTARGGKKLTLSGCRCQVLPIVTTQDGESTVAGRCIWVVDQVFAIQMIRGGRAKELTWLMVPRGGPCRLPGQCETPRRALPTVGAGPAD